MNASQTPPRALWIVSNTNPASAPSSQSGGRLRSASANDGNAAAGEQDVEGRGEEEREPRDRPRGRRPTF